MDLINIQISAVVHQTNQTFYPAVITLHILNFAICFCVNRFSIFSCLLFHEYDISVLLSKDI